MSVDTIRRDPKGASRERYDLIVVGGGVYGIMIALEATRRGLHPVLLERAEFAAATSANSLRVLHGGLRYLQRLDLRRSLESIDERAWWLRNFPDHTRPLPCLMPLYGEGLRRPLALRVALGLNELLCRVRGGDLLPQGRVIGPDAVREIFPGVDPDGLKGGALWYDAFAHDTPRLLLEVLRWACAEGAVALDQVEATGLLVESGWSTGVRARDVENDAELHFRAPVVINAAGPWVPAFATACGGHAPGLVPTLAWNVAFRRPALADHALAVRPRRKSGQTYFLVPWQNMLLAGTGHAVWCEGPERVRVPESLLLTYIAELNAAVPGLRLKDDEVVRVFAGLLPGRRAGTADLAERPVIVDHRAAGGPAGLYSVIGVKLTTARAVAARVLARAFPSAAMRPVPAFERSVSMATVSQPPVMGKASTRAGSGHDPN